MTSRNATVALLLLSLAWLSGMPRATHAGVEDLVITEICALNRSVLRDENDEFTDWLEVYNSGLTAVNLGGCFLTDDPAELTKWRFPSVTLAPSDFRVVFCSDKDRRSAGSELHTNFRLLGTGEFLALVAPDERTVLWAYAPSYPPQVENFSYGLKMDASFFRLVGDGASVRVRIPTSGDAGVANSLAWAEIGFNDAGWTPGTVGVGYDNNPDYDPLINTDVGGAMRNVNTSAWIRIPFTVTDPSEVETLVLRMKYDDGFIGYLNGVRVAAANAPASPAPWDAGATTDHADPEALAFQEWTFPNDGLIQAGTNILAIHGLNNGLGSSDFLIFPELDARGTGVLDPTTRQFFHLPTPGSGNAPGYPGVSPKPAFVPPSQVFQGSVSVELEVNPVGADVRYTLDGSAVTETSSLYTGPIQVSTSTVLRARSFQTGLSPSPMASATYLTIDSALRNRSSDVPLVIVDTFGGSIPGTGSTTFGSAFMAVFDVKGDGRSSFTNVPDIANRIGIRARGSSTGGRPKASYRFEFWDDQDEDRDLAPLGLPRESDWILYGAYNFDHTHMRNPFIYEMSRQVGRYAARTQFIELYLNTGGGSISTADYWGVYSFMETLKRGKDRIDIERLDPSVTTEPLIQGGYILKKDRGDPGGSGSFNAGGVDSIQYVYPDFDQTNPAQRSWIQSHLSTVFTTASFLDAIDPLAAIDHHILNAMPKNVDAFRLSGYFYKPRFGPVEFGPIWDFDRSMGSTDGRDDAWNTWRGTGDSSGYFEYDSRTPYWSRWLQNADFLQLWKDRWHEMRQGAMSTQNVQAVIDRMTSELSEAAPRDQSRWGQTSNWRGDVGIFRTWVTNRVNWIDTQWLRPPTLNRPAGPIDPGTEIGISGSGTIYYTVDGTDPRLAGGGTSPRASAYGGPIALETNARIVARTRASASNWSAAAAATYVVVTPPLVIAELMYHPLDPDLDSPYDADDFEFVEILNVGSEPVELAGARLTGGIRYTFSTFVSGEEAILLPGERVVVVKNFDAFQTRYDTSGMLLAGDYEGQLNNAGDSVGFDGPLLEPIHHFDYAESWYPETDGLGYSLSIIDPLAPLEDWALEESWAPSSVLHGTPGTDDSGLGTLGGRQLAGDGNQDGVLDISDGLTLLLRLFLGAPGPLPCDGASLSEGGNLALHDVSGDGAVNVTDALYILNYLFRNGPAPTLGSTCVRIEGCPSACRF